MTNNNNVTHEDIDIIVSLANEQGPIGLAKTRAAVLDFLGEQAGNLFDAVFGVAAPKFEHTSRSNGTVESEKIS